MVDHAREARLQMREPHRLAIALYHWCAARKVVQVHDGFMGSPVSVAYCEHGSVCIPVILTRPFPLSMRSRVFARVAHGYADLQRGAGCVFGMPAN